MAPFKSGYAGERYRDKEGTSGGGDAPPPPPPPKGKGGKEVKIPEPEELPKTPSQIAQEEAEYRSMLRKQRFKRKWPEITKVEIKTKRWRPPPPPKRLPRMFIDVPEVKTRKWVPPYKRRRRHRPKLQKIPAEEITKPLYDFAKLKRIWHGFSKVDINKMMLQGFTSCNSKKYSSTHCGSQTGAIAVMCKAMLEEKKPSDLVKRDVDDIIDQGDKYYRQCMICLKCYKGKPAIGLNQLLTSFFYHDTKYTVKMVEIEKGVLVKHPESLHNEPDLMALMEKRGGQVYNMVLTVGDRHFMIWGHPPEAGSAVKTVCYLFDPHTLNNQGQPDKLYGAGGFIRYAGVRSFVMDFLANYGDLNATKRSTPKPPIALTDIELSDQKQVGGWTSKDHITSMVVYDHEYDSYVGVFNNNTIKMWKDDTQSLEKVKKYKFSLKIMKVLCRPNASSLVILDNGNCATLSYGLDNRKNLEGTSMLESSDVITDVASYMHKGVDYVCYIVRNANDKYDIALCPLRPELGDMQRLKFGKVKIRRPEDVFVVGKMICVDEHPTVYVVWSDAKMTSYDLIKQSWRNVGSIPWLLTSTNVSCTWMGEKHLVFFGSDLNGEGAVVVPYNVALGVGSCQYPVKIYCEDSKIYCMNSRIILEGGNHLGLLPYILECSKNLSSLLGSHGDMNDDTTVFPDWGYGKVAFSVSDDVKELLKMGLTERAICAQLVPQFLEKKDVVALGTVMREFRDVPETVIVVLLEFVIQSLRVDGKFVTPNMEKDGQKYLLLNSILRIPFSDVSLIPHLRNGLSLSSSVFLMNYLAYFLVDDSLYLSFEHESNLFDWAALLLDSFYQQYLMSKDECVTEALENLRNVVVGLVDQLHVIDGVLPIIDKLLKKKIEEIEDDVNLAYSIELMNI